MKVLIWTTCCLFDQQVVHISTLATIAKNWLHGQVVKTSAFHAENGSSTLPGVIVGLNRRCKDMLAEMTYTS